MASAITKPALARIIRRVMRSLPKGSLPTPDVIADPSGIPSAQRRYVVGRYKYAGVWCAEFGEGVYVYLGTLRRDFADDEESIENALRKTLAKVARGFLPAEPT